MNRSMNKVVRTGWLSALAKLGCAVLLFETVTGLAITFAPFHPTVEWGLLLHTLIGAVTLLPLAWYLAVHWLDYKHYSVSHVVLLGYLAVLAILVCAVSGVVVTVQGLLALRMSNPWRQTHLVSSLVALGAGLPHVILVLLRLKREARATAWRFAAVTGGATAVGLAATAALPLVYSGTHYVNAFPEGYHYLYGSDKPFAPSLARTATGGAFDARSLAGSETCGSAGCHAEILAEWKPSAHRYAAMDPAFQKIQEIMAQQNGPESTRYCGGCHDPISLFSGTKNILVENLTNLHGYQEGVSCLVCHSIRETDLQGNANYTISQPSEYLWQWAERGAPKLVRDFLIRTYPDEHNRLSKRMFKAPEYCAACHKQFIDEQVNRVGWVQLQNQYDNWAASHWNQKGNPQKAVECRECHMPLVASEDPAAGDGADYNRDPGDGRHRSHRFVAANGMMPALLKLEGFEQQVALTEKWLQGRLEIPEIQHKWAQGPIVKLALETPEAVAPGETFPVRVVLTSNKVGHDFPTGPLDIIQSWIELRVTDEAGNAVFTSGRRDEKNFIEPGSFLFKVEPVDQYGNLIDRHNLWEMVGVRFRRALFPGYSDTVEYLVGCPTTLLAARDPASVATGSAGREFRVEAGGAMATYEVVASLMYRKVDQFLLNYMFGEDAGLSAPVVGIARSTATVRVLPRAVASRRAEAGGGQKTGG
jgi:hypothetical protein